MPTVTLSAYAYRARIGRTMAVAHHLADLADLRGDDGGLGLRALCVELRTAADQAAQSDDPRAAYADLEREVGHIDEWLARWSPAGNQQI